MPPKFINANYYNLVNNTILNPININNYLININNTELPNIIYIDNPEKKSMEDVLVDISCCIGENTIHIHSLYNDKKEAYTQLFTSYLGVSSKFIMIYLQELRKDNIITWQDYLLLIRLMTKNTHKIRDSLINFIINAFILC